MNGVSLTAREYKLLLDAGSFKGEPTLETANALWTKRFLPIVKQRLQSGAIDKSSRRGFTRQACRKVSFLDTPKGILAAHSYSLRQRDELEAGEVEATEISLKLRTPDLFVAAGTKLPGAPSKQKSKPETKLEEDIAPLAVKPSAGGAKSGVTLPKQRSMRSRFSLSTKQSLTAPRTFGELAKIYPTLSANLRSVGAKLPAASAKLVRGKPIREFVFKGPETRLGDGCTCEFAMTVWYFGSTKAPGSVEISYTCKLDDGNMPLTAAHRAYDLFIGLQSDLGKLLETGETSKTALALPRRVGTP